MTVLTILLWMFLLYLLPLIINMVLLIDNLLINLIMS